MARFAERHFPSDPEPLVDGVPVHLALALQTWVDRHSPDSERWCSRQVAQTRDDNVALSLSSDPREFREAILEVLQLSVPPDVFIFSILEEMLQYSEEALRTVEPAMWLEEILEAAGSVWRVDIDSCRIEVRVDEAVRAAFEESVYVASRSAGDHLKTAWASAYGQSPSGTDAYEESVKAVEAAAQPIVIPTNPRATLGTIIQAIEAKPSKWEFVIPSDDLAQPEQLLRLVEIMRLLWTGHERHGEPGRVARNSLPEAQMAVHLAATLVQAFGSGAVKGLQ